jgi:DNA-binding FadR family transcriptional regulator
LVSHHATTLEDPAYWAPWLSDHREDVMALLEVREALEVKATKLAAEAVAKGSPGVAEHLVALAKNVADMEDAARRVDVSTLERFDLEFHVILGQMSGNRYLLRLAKSINHVFPDRRAVLALPGRAAQSLEEHRRIASAIQEGRPAEAGQAYSDHLRSLQATIEEIEGE